MNIIITDNNIIQNELITLLDLKSNKENIDWLEISKDESITLIYINSNTWISNVINYIKNNILTIELLIYSWLATSLCSDYIDSDVILPIAFIKEWEDSYFIDSYEKSLDFNFENFWLSISWIMSWDLNPTDPDSVDLISSGTFNYIKELNNSWFSKNLRVISWIISEDKKNISEVSKNISFITRFIIDTFLEDNK